MRLGQGHQGAISIERIFALDLTRSCPSPNVTNLPSRHNTDSFSGPKCVYGPQYVFGRVEIPCRKLLMVIIPARAHSSGLRDRPKLRPSVITSSQVTIFVNFFSSILLTSGLPDEAEGFFLSLYTSILARRPRLQKKHIHF